MQRNAERASSVSSRDPESYRKAWDSAILGHPGPSVAWAGLGPRFPLRTRCAPKHANAREGPLESLQRLDLHRKHGWQVLDDGLPGISGVGRQVHLPTRSAEIHSAFI